MIRAEDPRIAVLARRLGHGRHFDQRTCDERAAIYHRVLAAEASLPRIRQLADALAAFLTERRLLVLEEDLLAGSLQVMDYSMPDPALPASTAAGRKWYERATRLGLITTCPGGHTIAGYEHVLAVGIGGILKEINSRLTCPCDDAQHDFLVAAGTTWRAAEAYTRRYARAANALANQTSNTVHRETLRTIAADCTHIATTPPETFRQALQLLWLTHEILVCEQFSGSLSLGRLDQVLRPFYDRDRAAGRLTFDQAQNLILALWTKFASLPAGYQNVTLGGATLAGEDISNDLTVMMLRASRRLQMDQPLISMRCHPAMSDELWDEVLAVIASGQGFPAMFNDAVVIDAKAAVGVTRNEAAGYGIVGCVEMAVPGREFSHTEGQRLNWAKALELFLNGGRCMLTSQGVGPTPPPLDTLTTFEAFLAAFKTYFAGLVDEGIAALDDIEQDFTVIWPYPFLSATMAGCVDAARDVTAGGTVYNFSTLNGCGMADLADSLAAIKTAVYDQAALSLSALAEAMVTDFADDPTLAATLASIAPRFGNGDDLPDALLAELAEAVCDRVVGRTNWRGGGYQVGLYTVSAHAGLGELTAALPNGRRRGVSLANGLSPCQGADRSGPTAVIHSLTKLDHRRLGNGMVLDMKFAPALLADSAGRDGLRRLIETYFAMGGMEIQFNVIDRATLLAAQAEPGRYADLVVRVSGFSAYFVDLDATTQAEIIARTEHGL